MEERRGEENAILLHNIGTCSKQCSIVVLRNVLPSDKEGKVYDSAYTSVQCCGAEK